MNKKAVRALTLAALLILGVWLVLQVVRPAAPAPASSATETSAPSAVEHTALPLLDVTPTPSPPAASPSAAPAEDGQYDARDDVARYLAAYGHLPSNYVTKSVARKAGWSGGSLEPYFPGCSIGGDVFQNREGSLPDAPGRVYYECDIDTRGKKSRGEKRLIFSNDGLIYYTDDHYETFTLLAGEEA